MDYSIRDVSEILNLSREMIRYYEKKVSFRHGAMTRTIIAATAYLISLCCWTPYNTEAGVSRLKVCRICDRKIFSRKAVSSSVSIGNS